MTAAVVDLRPPQVDPRISVRRFGEMWTSGELYRFYPGINALKLKRTAKIDAYRFRRDIYPLIGERAMADITESDVEFVMSRLPSDRRALTRMRFYNILHRLFVVRFRSILQVTSSVEPTATVPQPPDVCGPPDNPLKRTDAVGGGEQRCCKPLVLSS